MGYDLDRFVGTIDKEFECPICCMVLEDPRQTLKCYHTFCSKCIQEWMKRESNCPFCRQRLTTSDVVPVPLILRNLIGNLSVRCDLACQGCPAIIRFQDLAAHVRNCDFNRMNVVVYTEEVFMEHKGPDLYDIEKAKSRKFNVKSASTIFEVMQLLATHFKYPVRGLRIWPLRIRLHDKTLRPSPLDYDYVASQKIVDVAEDEVNWHVFLELIKPDSKSKELPHYDLDNNVLLLVKYYDPKHGIMTYAGLTYPKITSKVRDLFPILNKMVGLPPKTPLQIYEVNYL